MSLVKDNPIVPGTNRAVKIIVDEPDLIEAWSALEYLVVSLRRIGGYHATPSVDVPQTSTQRQAMLEDIDRLMDHELFRKLSRARIGLSKYLPGDEAEAMSDALPYFQPTVTDATSTRPIDPQTRG